MVDCSMTQSEAAKNWPEGVISVKMTMNPYVLAMALEESLVKGIRLWEFVNTALWEKLGKPDHDTLMEFAANLEVFDEDPKWKKRLKITARHEVEVAAYKKSLRDQDEPESIPADGDGHEGR
ncbi:MAG: hypothetical protein RDU20_20905 [Desulfomonilaceae bacterium]|nr:hypothetical protein [Desulfomonilaceae bacterium]